MTSKVGQSDAPLRVAVIAACPFPYPRGTPIRIHRLSNALAARGHDVHVFAYHLGTAADGDKIVIHRSARVPTYKRTAPGPSYQKLLVVDPLLTAKFFFGLIGARFDVVHAHHYEGLLVAKGATLGRRIPLIFDAHTLLRSELRSYGMGLSKPLSGRLGARLDSWLPRLADHVVSVTGVIKDKLVAYGVADDRITVITNGVEHEIFKAAASSSPPRQPPTLMFTGNLAPYQGIELLLKAFARIIERRGDVRLLLVTRSPFEPYEDMARELGVRDRIEIVTAPFEDQPALLAGATIAVNPRAVCDGVPQKLLNYMAAGRATVSFEGSAPCIVHGKNGWIVRSGDTDAFAEGVLSLLEDPERAQRLGDEARRTVLDQYTWASAAEKTEAVYRRLVSRDQELAAVPRQT